MLPVGRSGELENQTPVQAEENVNASVRCVAVNVIEKEEKGRDMLTIVVEGDYLSVPVPKLPWLHHSRAKIEECSNLHGHILRIKDDVTIVCKRCPAEWKVK